MLTLTYLVLGTTMFLLLALPVMAFVMAVKRRHADYDVPECRLWNEQGIELDYTSEDHRRWPV